MNVVCVEIESREPRVCMSTLQLKSSAKLSSSPKRHCMIKPKCNSELGVSPMFHMRNLAGLQCFTGSIQHECTFAHAYTSLPAAMQCRTRHLQALWVQHGLH